MPNIFPPIELSKPTVGAMVDPQAGVAGPLGSVSGPSGAALSLNSADNGLQAAQDKYASDAPKKYDYSAHGVLGNVGHVLARTANIAGDILDPAATELIPNSDLYNAHKRAGDLEEVDKAQDKQIQAQRESDTVENEQKTRDAAAPLQASEVDKNEAEAAKALNPTEMTPDRQVYDYLTKQLKMTPQEAFKELSAEKAKATVQRPDTPEQQAIDEYQKLHPGATVAQAEHAYAQNTHIQQPPQVMMMIPNASGGSTAQVIKPGSSVAPGAQTAAGVNAMSTPTNTQRTSAGRAELVLNSIPDVTNDLRMNAAQLGPGMGRFNEIYQGKVGAPNKEFAGLMADLHLMATAVTLAHAQGRMSGELLNEFNSMIAAPQQTAGNIEAVLGKVQNFMQRTSDQGHVNGGSAGGPPAGAKVIDFTQLGKK